MTIILLLLSTMQLIGPANAAIPNRLRHPQDRCGIVRGRVIDEKGNPVDRVRVFAIAVNHPPNMRSETETETDPRGEFSLPCLEPGPNAIWISKEREYYPNTFSSLFPGDWKNPLVRISAGEAINGLEVRLPPQGSRLSGRVIDGVSGKLMDTAVLRLCRAKTRDCRNVSARTVNEGFSFVLPALDLTLQVSAPGYVTSKPVQVALKRGVTKTITVPLTRQSP
jgi:hypothetical protein